MTGLSSFFESLRDNPSHYLRVRNGKEFEGTMLIGLEDSGYSLMRKQDVPDHFDAIKTECLRTNALEDLQNHTRRRNHFIRQPLGSQNYPDFLVFCGDKIYSLEVKYSTGGGAKPMWNSGLPRPNGFYIFGSHGQRQITFFRGCDVISASDAEKMHEFFNTTVKGVERQFNEQQMAEQKYGFTVYNRKAFEQNKKHNPNAVLNFFDNPDRANLENSVISHFT